MSVDTLLARLGLAPLHLLPRRACLAFQFGVALVSAALGVLCGPESPLTVSQTRRHAMSQRLEVAREQADRLPGLQTQALRLGLAPQAGQTALAPMASSDEIQSALLAWFETVALACGVELQRFGLLGAGFDGDPGYEDHRVGLTGPDGIDKRWHPARQGKAMAAGDDSSYPSHAVSLQAQGSFATVLAFVEQVAAADPPFIPLRGYVQAGGERLHLELELLFEGMRAPGQRSIDRILASAAPRGNPFHQALGPRGKPERLPRLLGTLVSGRRRQAIFDLAGRQIVVGPGHVFDTRIVDRIEPSAVTVVARDDGSSAVISVRKGQ